MKNIYRKILLILNVKERNALYALLLECIIINLIDVASLFMIVFAVSYCTGQSANSQVGAVLMQFFHPDNEIFMICFVLFFALKSFGGYKIVHRQYKFVYSVASRLSGQNILRYFEGSYADYVNLDSTAYVRRVAHQPIEFSHYVLDGAIQVVIEFTMLLLTVAAILIFNVKLFFLLVLLIGPPLALVAFLVKKKLKKVRANIKPQSQKTLQYLSEALSGYVESNIYLKNDFFASRYVNNQKKLNTYLSDMHSIQNVSSRIIEVFAICGLFVLIAANKFLGSAHVSEIINIAAFMVAAYKIIPGIVKIANASAQMRTFSFTLDDLLSDKYPTRKNIIPAKEKIKALSFNNVSFSYPQKKVLEDFTMSLHEGDIAGISAPSGIGKTTIINLLMGFLQPQTGAIAFNDKITDMQGCHKYWGSIAYVKQQPFVIHDSLLNNIVLGEHDYDEQRLQNAISFSGLEQLISTTSDGLQLLIAENGKNISGGQRQRITLARAVYKNADVIVLDEPFNELDENAEVAMLKNFQLLAKQGKIIILITHNKTGLSFCNKIVALNGNRQ